MEMKSIMVGQLDVNCYILTDNNEAAVIDPGGDAERIISAVGEASLKMILLTHGHFDHIGAVRELAEKTGAPVFIHKADAVMLYDNSKNLSFMTEEPPESSHADVFLEDLQTLKLGNAEITVYHTPGHSDGSVCFLCENSLFDGDLLFHGSIGRFDHGNLHAELDSLQRLMKLFKDDVSVYPGHGEATTIGIERQYNPYIANHIN